MKKYNRDFNKKTLDFPDGGLPVYSDDLQQIETNSNLSNVYSILKGYSVVLSGCLITNVNTNTKKCDMTKGLVLIDDIVYVIDALVNQTYPFSIQNGDTVDDVRGFENNVFYTVATTYNYSIRTNFVFDDILDVYPSNLTNKEVYFDPFTCQRSEYVLNNLSKRKGECFVKNNAIGLIDRDEAGNYIVGSTLWNLGNNVLKYAYYGYRIIENNGGSLNLSSTIGSLTGSNSKLLTESNLPKHEHFLKYGTATEAGSHYHDFENNIGVTDVFHANLGDYSHKNIYNKKNQPQVNLYGADSIITNGKTVVAITDQTIGEPSHTHDVVGKTNGGEYYFDSNNLATSNIQTAIDVSGKIYGVSLMEYVGYPINFSIVNPLSSTGYQIIGYKFWEDVKYMNM